MKSILLILLFFSASASANDMFGFLLPNCELVEGVPVGFDEGKLTVLSAEGQTREVSVAQVNGIAHYVLQESAFHFSKLPKGSLEFAKNFEIKDSDIKLKGFPYQFIDGTIFILDHRGARQVFGREEIGRVKKDKSWTNKESGHFKKTTLSLPSGITGCPKVDQGLMPVRFLADKIQILEMVSEWEKGFRELNDLAERSQFYPRPFLFDRHDRFGFIFFNFDEPKTLNLFPVRYSFSNGDDFRFQGESFIGGGFDQIGPVATPMNLVSTHLKFHFLHASFEGNIDGMAMGASLYNKGDIAEYGSKRPRDAYSAMSFNHMALIGFDWQNFGLSFGPMYPVLYVQAGADSREATPQESVPVLRLTWMNDFLKFKVTGSVGTLRANSEMSKKSEILEGASQDEPVDKYNVDFKFLRPGVEWDLTSEIKLTYEMIWVSWDYEDTKNATNLTYKAKQLSSLLSVRKEFSDYVALGLNLLLTRPEDEGTYEGKSFSRSSNHFNLGGTFEFLF